MSTGTVPVRRIRIGKLIIRKFIAIVTGLPREIPYGCSGEGKTQSSGDRS